MNLIKASVVLLACGFVGTSSSVPTDNYLRNAEQTSRRTVGGWEVPTGRYDYFVQGYATLGGPICGGFLVADNAVLTAAHCAEAFKKSGSVALGSNGPLRNISHDRSGGRSELIDIFTTVPHPKYFHGSVGYDYMVVVLERKSRYPPVCIAGDGNGGGGVFASGDGFRTIGLGRTSLSGSLSDILRETELKYISNDECDDIYGNILSDQMMCTVSSGPDTDVFKGDSGGPLIIKGDSAENDVAVGIVSFNKINGVYPGGTLQNKRGTQLDQRSGTTIRRPAGSVQDDSRISEEHNWIKGVVQQYGGRLAPCKTPLRSGHEVTDSRPSYEYLGCYTDKKRDRIFSVEAEDRGATMEECATLAKDTDIFSDNTRGSASAVTVETINGTVSPVDASAKLETWEITSGAYTCSSSETCCLDPLNMKRK
eukprot:CAMPEP_0194299520 /NCGR_PEP_ID=MMETSP0169-20130528/60765_1 /TAXON_ID=218684 /ORGANISM="Corethron pennatum, Strain L29A3" /LENGTH=423 /DNA_ID=CAMNT_0039049623 /DNA_START=11 /DNA_END=1279 /DNA_ORIENTATION=-